MEDILFMPFFRRGHRSSDPAEDRLGRLRKVLDCIDAEYPHDAPEVALDRLTPRFPPEYVPQAPAQKLQFPIAMSPRLALFEGGFETDGAIRNFSSDEWSRLGSWVPDALALPLQLALTIADQKQRDLIDLPALTTAVIVFTSLGDSPLADHHRDLLWHAFHVPVFEQLRGWDGAVVARECEVHDGLHLEPTAIVAQMQNGELIATQLTSLDEPIVRVRTGFTAEIVSDHCECGLDTPRLLNLATRSKAGTAIAGH